MPGASISSLRSMGWLGLDSSISRGLVARLNIHSRRGWKPMHITPQSMPLAVAHRALVSTVDSSAELMRPTARVTRKLDMPTSTPASRVVVRCILRANTETTTGPDASDIITTENIATVNSPLDAPASSDTVMPNATLNHSATRGLMSSDMSSMPSDTGIRYALHWLMASDSATSRTYMRHMSDRGFGIRRSRRYRAR